MSPVGKIYPVYGCSEAFLIPSQLPPVTAQDVAVPCHRDKPDSHRPGSGQLRDQSHVQAGNGISLPQMFSMSRTKPISLPSMKLKPLRVQFK